MSRVRLTLATAVLFVLALAAPGCSKHEVTRPAPQPTAPAPSTPTQAVRLFEWGWDHLELSSLETVLAEDSVFVFSTRDSAGIPSREPPLTREQVLCAAKQLFQGGGTQPRATSITLTLAPSLEPLPDSRPGKDPAWHKEIATSVDLLIRVAGGKEFRVVGHTRFFVTRGDSAHLPDEPGLVADSTRWYVERWDDDAPGIDLRAVPARPLPGAETTWGTILSLYRCP